MLDEISVLHNNGTWDLVTLPSRKSIVGYMWIFTFKVGFDSIIDHLKARVMTKGFT